MKFNRLIYAAPFMLFSVAIFWFSHQSQPLVPDIGFQWQDKLYHFLAYFLYGLSASLAARTVLPGAGRRYIFVFVVIAVMIYGASDEFHQSFIPGRSSEFADWIADSLGGIVAAIVISLVIRRRELAKQGKNTNAE